MFFSNIGWKTRSLHSNSFLSPPHISMRLMTGVRNHLRNGHTPIIILAAGGGGVNAINKEDICTLLPSSLLLRFWYNAWWMDILTWFVDSICADAGLWWLREGYTEFILGLKCGVLLFSWSPARAVWPNYYVVFFQPRSGTAPSPVSVANITCYLNPEPPFNSLLDRFLSPSVFWLPPPSATCRLGWTILLEPDSLPSLPVLDLLSTWTVAHSLRPPPPVLFSMYWCPWPDPEVWLYRCCLVCDSKFCSLCTFLTLK